MNDLYFLRVSFFKCCFDTDINAQECERRGLTVYYATTRLANVGLAVWTSESLWSSLLLVLFIIIVALFEAGRARVFFLCVRPGETLWEAGF